jgi:hypothetical protein
MSIYSGAHGHVRTVSSARANRQEKDVKATQRLHEQGQSLWLDNITREMLDPG